MEVPDQSLLSLVIVFVKFKLESLEQESADFFYIRQDSKQFRFVGHTVCCDYSVLPSWCKSSL